MPMNKSEAAQLKELEDAEKCPTCGQMKMPAKEEMGPEQGGKHTMMGEILGTNYPGYKLRKGQKISGG